MPYDDEGPSDWEIKDEEPPERLQKKWEQEEAIASPRRICPSCKKETPAENLACIFCGALLPRTSGSMGCFLSWIKRLLKRG